MLASEGFLQYCRHGNYNVDEGLPHVSENDCETYDKKIVLSLSDNESKQVLDLQTKSKIPNDSSKSVVSWINSLNECCNEKPDEHSCQVTYTDQDDLYLGDEAIDLLQRKQKTSKSDTSQSDSEDGRSSSKVYRSHIFRRLKSQEKSIDSDFSCRSSNTSVSSLLSARESDPEEVLKNLGFSGPRVIDHIPDRFITAGTTCQGINTCAFISSILDENINKTNIVPPWVEARIEDIPSKFLNTSTTSMTELCNTSQSVCLITENKEEGEYNCASVNNTVKSINKTTTFSSKFGTHLEPVSEEVESSSQGSVNLNLDSANGHSFDSNRSSTLRADSREDFSSPSLYDSKMLLTANKIPSLKDLWSTTEDSSSEFITSRDETEFSSNLNNTEDASLRESSCQLDERFSRETDNSSQVTLATPGGKISSLDDYFDSSDKNALKMNSLDSAASFLPQSSTEMAESENKSTAVDAASTNNFENETIYPDRVCPVKATIPSIIISKLKEPVLKVSVTDVPDLQKLNPEEIKKTGTKKAGKLTKSLPQCNCLDGKWVFTNFPPRSTAQAQIHISVNAVQKKADCSSSGKKIQNFGIVKRRSPYQITFIAKCTTPENIQCFWDVGRPSYKKRNPSLAICQRSSGFCSLPTPTNSNRSSPQNLSCGNDNQRYDDRGFQHVPEIEQPLFVDDKEKSEGNCERGNRKRKLLTSKGSVEDDLENLQSSLKSIKIYKAGVHLMQLASSVETVFGENRSQPVRSCQQLLESIKKELKDSEKYILQVQNRLSNLKSQKIEKLDSQKGHDSMDFPEITNQLLREQLKMFNSITTSMSPSSTPSRQSSNDDNNLTTEITTLHHEITKLRNIVENTKQENENHYSRMKAEIVKELKTEITSSLKEFFQKE